MAPPPRYSSSCSDSMQKYIQLSSQQEILHRRLSLNLPTATPMVSMSPETQSTGSSPTRSRPVFTSPWSPDSSYTTTASNPIPARPSKRHSSVGDTEDAHRLAEVNQEIKATLTELLNTNTCRTDGKYRQWVQGRLMDVEHEIRQQRRRRSSGSSVGEREFASAAAESLEFNLPPYKPW
ncbi:unnamed protein product [Periconia digitata]|uniref:Uncharacterized protein n=1 Tax=Periconia digitata TaxID=1303443 RepID=A0A9W4XN60_9PLEO|nr:unnamed protein product [Periconia digitata]